MSDAILIESNGHYGLVDASNPDENHILDINGNHWNRSGGIESECGDDCSNPKTNVTAVVNYLRNLGVNHLDFVLTTHNHSDHVGGMPTIASSGFVNGNTTYYYKDCRKNSEDTSAKGTLASGAYTGWQNYNYCKNAGSSMQGSGAKMYNFDFNNRLDQFDFYGSKINLYNVYDGPTNRVKHASDNENRNSIVVKVTDDHNKKTLLTSDILKEEEHQLLNIGPVDVLKLSHHGIIQTNSTEFINAMNPKEAVMTNFDSCGGRSDCNTAALSLLRQKGIKLNVTADTGGVVVDSSSGNLTVNTVTSSTIPKDNSLSGWVERNGNWYYYLNNVPIKGWRELDWSGGKGWFYFNDQGIMLKNTNTPDGYHVDGNGVWDQKKPDSINQNNQTKVGGSFNKWSKVGDTWYYFDDQGNKVTGWQKIKDTYYYFESDGRLRTGWLKRDDKYYYYDDNGNLLKDTTTPDGYKVDRDGVWIENTQNTNHPSNNGSSSNNPTNNSPQTTNQDPGASGSGSNTNSSSTQSTNSGSGSSTSGGGTSSGGKNCVKTAVIRINGRDCIENSREAIFTILGMILNIFTFGVGIAASAGLLFCGYQYMTSKNEPAVIVKIKTRVMHIVIGLVFYFMFWGIITLLLPGGV